MEPLSSGESRVLMFVSEIECGTAMQFTPTFRGPNVHKQPSCKRDIFTCFSTMLTFADAEGRLANITVDFHTRSCKQQSENLINLSTDLSEEWKWCK